MAVAACCYIEMSFWGYPNTLALLAVSLPFPASGVITSQLLPDTQYHWVGSQPRKATAGPHPPPPTAAPPNFRPLGSLPGGAGQPLQLLLPVNDLPSGPKDHFHSILFCLHLLAERLNYSAVDKPVPVSSGLDCGSQRPWPVSKSIYFVSL